jgi:TRAP-type C4-dicarboxylate transport system permease small subunit
MPDEKEVGLFPINAAPWEKVVGRITLGVLYFGMAVMFILMLLTVVHAVGRYAFNAPIEGLVELSCFMLVIIIFSTAAHTEVKKSHIVIGTIVDRFSEKTQAIIDSISYVLSLLLTLVAFWYTIEQGFYYIEEDYGSLILSIPHYPFVFFVAIGWITLAVAIVLRLINFLKTIRRATQ